MTRIALHTATYCNAEIYISTVQIYADYFETMVLFEDGEELESITASTLEEAKKNHNAIMNKWNDKIYDGSIAKLLGSANIGQFVNTVVAC